MEFGWNVILASPRGSIHYLTLWFCFIKVFKFSIGFWCSIFLCWGQQWSSQRCICFATFKKSHYSWLIESYSAFEHFDLSETSTLLISCTFAWSYQLLFIRCFVQTKFQPKTKKCWHYLIYYITEAESPCLPFYCIGSPRISIRSLKGCFYIYC